MSGDEARRCGRCVCFRSIGNGDGLCMEPVCAVRWCGKVRDVHVLVEEGADGQAS